MLNGFVRGHLERFLRRNSWGAIAFSFFSNFYNLTTWPNKPATGWQEDSLRKLSAAHKTMMKFSFWEVFTKRFLPSHQQRTEKFGGSWRLYASTCQSRVSQSESFSRTDLRLTRRRECNGLSGGWLHEKVSRDWGGMNCSWLAILHDPLVLQIARRESERILEADSLWR